jgi:hypothetical protein
MMYLAFAPRSKADVGTIVELSEKIVSITINDARNLALERVSIRTPWVVHTMSGHCDNFKLPIPICPEPAPKPANQNAPVTDQIDQFCPTTATNTPE